MGTIRFSAALAISFLLFWLAGLMRQQDQESSMKRRRRMLSILVLAIALAITATVISGLEESWSRAEKARTVKRNELLSQRKNDIDALLGAGNELRIKFYPLCNPGDRRGLYKEPHTTVVQWRKTVADLLEAKVSPQANKRFQEVTLNYPHHECGQVEWIKRWLDDQLRQLPDIFFRLE